LHPPHTDQAPRRGRVMSDLDTWPVRILHALVALGYARTRRNPRTGELEFQFDAEKCLAAAGGDAHVPEFLARAAHEFLTKEHPE
jgi:hypothetical protein